MSLHDDLLSLARTLAGLDPTRPKQATLRRAISTAYYAVFHMLTAAATRLFVRDTPELAGRLNRTFQHGDMKKASTEFASGRLPTALTPRGGGPRVFSADLKRVLEVFTKLQQERHAADYDTLRRFTRDEARALVVEAEAAFASWQSVSQTDDARLYLGCFLLWKTWNDKEPR